MNDNMFKGQSCPLAGEVISMRDKIESQRLRIKTLESKFDLLTIEQIKEEARECGMLKGMRIAALVIGYSFLAGLVLLVMHVMGVAEFVARILKM